MAAVEAWPKSHVPDNPSAWLFRVAHNHLVGELRQRTRRAELAGEHSHEPRLQGPEPPQVLLNGDVRDDFLRMLFACCDDALPVESQLVLALKVLCGFDIPEIAERLFISEANIYKRLARARSRLREVEFDLDELTSTQLASAPSAAVRAALERRLDTR
jgi:RNA polymerase sigma factor (sigma-70 family)